jgi:hypothetical protein
MCFSRGGGGRKLEQNPEGGARCKGLGTSALTETIIFADDTSIIIYSQNCYDSEQNQTQFCLISVNVLLLTSWPQILIKDI